MPEKTDTKWFYFKESRRDAADGEGDGEWERAQADLLYINEKSLDKGETFLTAETTGRLLLLEARARNYTETACSLSLSLFP
jgi:hypothetical protein